MTSSQTAVDDSRCSWLWHQVYMVGLSDWIKYFELENFGITINSFALKITFYMFNSLKRIITSFGDFNIFHWLIVSGVIWIITYGLYLKCMKLLLQRVGVAKQDQNNLLETIWHLCLTVISLPVILSCVGGSVREIWSLSGGWVDKLDYQLSKCKIHEDISVPGVWTVFVLHSSFSVHDFVNIWYSKGFKNLEFLQKQLFLAVFILTYYSKCPTLGLSVLFLLHRATLVELVSKLCWLLAHFTSSTVLHFFTKVLCGYFLVVWSGAFLYTLPVFLSLSKTINSHMLKAELKTLILLDFLLWVYVSTSILISMFTRVMMSVVMPGPDRPRTLEHFLFGCDPWVQKLTRQGKRSKTFVLPVEEPLTNSEDSLSRPSNHSRALYQTIRCSILLKRKIRRMREKKAKQAAQEQTEQNKTLNAEVNGSKYL